MLESRGRSQVGSLSGDVSITAGNTLNTEGAEVTAGQDINLTAQTINLGVGVDENTTRERLEVEQSGFSVSVGGLGAGQGSLGELTQLGRGLSEFNNTFENIGQVEDSRVKALGAINAGIQAQRLIGQIDGAN